MLKFTKPVVSLQFSGFGIWAGAFQSPKPPKLDNLKKPTKVRVKCV